MKVIDRLDEIAEELFDMANRLDDIHHMWIDVEGKDVIE